MESNKQTLQSETSGNITFQGQKGYNSQVPPPPPPPPIENKNVLFLSSSKSLSLTSVKPFIFRDDYLLTGYSFANNNYRMSYIYFPVSNLKLDKGLNVDKVYLKMRTAPNIVNGENENPQFVSIYQLISPIDDSISWVTQPSYIRPGIKTLVDKFNKYYEWDITIIYKQWIEDPTSNFGLLIANEDSLYGMESTKTFYSSAFGCIQYVPELVLITKK